MRSDAFFVATMALAIGLLTAAVTTATRAQTEPLTGTLRPMAAFRYVDECGQRFVELAPQAEPRTLTWGDFGQPFASYYGVVAYAHGKDGDLRRENPQGLYQCTELVHRYLKQTYAIPTRIGLGLGHGVDLARGLAERFGGQTFTGGVTGETSVSLRYFADSRDACRPMVGSVVSIAMNYDDGTPSPGHVAIIRALEPDSDVLIATLFEQHGGSSLTPGDEFDAGQVRFSRVDGAWTGAYLSQSGRTFPVAGWTSVVAP
jgi:hypothetical protein